MAYHHHDNHGEHLSALGVNNGDFNQPSKRASLLAGLRTGGPRPSSPAPGFNFDQFVNGLHAGHNNQQQLHLQQQQQHQFHPDPAQLKATAAVFTPRVPGSGSPEHELSAMQAGPGHNVSINERLALMQQHHAQHQQIQNAQAHLAALYANSNGQHGRGQQQQQQQMAEYQSQQEQLLLQQQKNAQHALQNQLAVQQQHMQLEMLRLQAVQQQQAQQQQMQAQQRALLAQLGNAHLEYERHAQIAALAKRQEEMQEHLRLQQRAQEELAHHATLARLQQQQQQQQHGSAREQRQAAQASIQASLRDRRDEQLHAQQAMLMQQLQRFGEGNGANSYDQPRLTSPPPSANGAARQVLSAQQQFELDELMRQISLGSQQEEDRVQQQRQHSAAQTLQQLQRTQSPPAIHQDGNQANAGNKKDRLSLNADGSASWRSSLGAIAGVAALRKNSNTPPSIVIDDSDSDYSVSRSSIDGPGSMRRSGVLNQQQHGGHRSGLARVNHGRSSGSEPDTPETSEEDLAAFSGHTAGKLAGSGVDIPAVLPSGQINSKATNVIRSSALAGLFAQRTRVDSLSGAAAAAGARSGTGHGLASLPARPTLALNGRTPSPPTDGSAAGSGTGTPSNNQVTKVGAAAAAAAVAGAPRRQPKGPPMEFLPHNFASRISLRTRREAMSKLCASPRAGVLSFAAGGGAGVLTRAAAA